jgi:hypothetical protein
MCCIDAVKRQRNVVHVIIFIVAFTLAGCGGDDSGRVEVSGEVTFGGSAVESGRVNFIPEGDTKGPASGGEVVAGSFIISQERGPVPGKYLVRVQVTPTGPSDSSAGRKSTKQTRPPTKEEVLSGTRDVVADDGDVDPMEEAGDARNYSVPEFHVTVTADGPNSFTLAIEED